MNETKVFLTYNKWKGEFHTGTVLDDKGLSAYEIQEAIDLYVKTHKNANIK